MVNYIFTCRTCNVSGNETFVQRQANFSQMCMTAVANLTFDNKESGKAHFSKDQEIIPFIDGNWENLTSMPRRVKLTWHQTIGKTMQKDVDIFEFRIFHQPGSIGGSGIDTFGLVEKDLSKIGPNYDQMLLGKMGHKVGDNGGISLSHSSMLKQPQVTNTVLHTNGGRQSPNTTRGRSSQKRKSDSANLSMAKRSKNEQTAKQLFNDTASDHPHNKDGYRYYLAEDDEHAPNRQLFDESNDYAGKPIPGYMYRVLRPTKVMLSTHDRAPQIKLNEARDVATGEKGYSVSRCTHGVSYGNWYYEVTINSLPDGAHTRIGWSLPLGCLQAPVGYDKFSFSWRSRKGTKFHDSIGKHYSTEDYKAGDVLGFYISLPLVGPLGTDKKKNLKIPSKYVGDHLPPAYKDLPLVKFRNNFYYEEKDDIAKETSEMTTLSGSKMVCFRNGEKQGDLYNNFPGGYYIPAISLYKSAQVAVNFGPDFKFPPPSDLNAQPFSDRAELLTVEQCLANMLYLVNKEGKLTI